MGGVHGYGDPRGVGAAKPEPVAFLLWGRRAQENETLIGEPHVVLTAAHPSPYSARGFFGRKPFGTANTELAAVGRPEIDWSLTDAV